jgi:hypothetical protein
LRRRIEPRRCVGLHHPPRAPPARHVTHIQHVSQLFACTCMDSRRGARQLSGAGALMCDGRSVLSTRDAPGLLSCTRCRLSC